MANYSPEINHLVSTRWQPGISGNPSGKPKGTKHISTWVQELLESEDFECQFVNGTLFRGAPIKAIIQTAIIRAIMGDMRALDLLAKYGYGTKVDITSRSVPVPILGGLSLRPKGME
jgi:hypothetical protein